MENKGILVREGGGRERPFGDVRAFYRDLR